jgi:hypothetical protein
VTILYQEEKFLLIWEINACQTESKGDAISIVVWRWD